MWSNVAAHVMTDAPELGGALDSLTAEHGAEHLALHGRPGETCWGTDGARPALFCALGDRDLDLLVPAMQVQGLVGGLLKLELRSQAGVQNRSALALVKLLRHPDCALETLDLTGCEIGGEGIAALCEALAENATVKVLRLGWNPLGRQGGLAVAEMLKRNGAIEVLGLCNTGLDTMATVCLYAVLRDQRVLVDVDLQKALLYSRHEDTTKAAGQMLCINRTMVTLNLANVTCGDLGAETLAKALERNATLRILSLANNQIGMGEEEEAWRKSSARAAAPAADCPAANPTPTRCAPLLASARRAPSRRCSAFSRLRCSAGAAGAHAFADLLGRGGACSLVALDLSSNRLGEDGGAALGSQGIAGNTVLRRLDLRSCRLGPRALLAVAQGMAMNSTLRGLKLWGNDFPEGGELAAGGNDPRECLKALQGLLRGRWLHLEVDTDVQVYEVDGVLLAARRN